MGGKPKNQFHKGKQIESKGCTFWIIKYFCYAQNESDSGHIDKNNRF